jgi:serine/threonine protein phosphatase 1
MKRTFVLGDIHGGYKALIQVLRRVDFDYEIDELIFLGDVADGWTETAESIEELMKIKNLIHMLGNHDDWMLDMLRIVLTNGEKLGLMNWLEQGGRETVMSYNKHLDLVDKHIDFLNNAKMYHIDDENRLFLHAGFIEGIDIDKQSRTTYFWDRSLWNEKSTQKRFNLDITDIKGFKEVYIGHTPTIRDFGSVPVNIGNLWNMDTGAAFSGRLSLMDVNTKEVVQSDPLQELYPNENGRN